VGSTHLAPLEYKNGNKPIPKGGHGVQMAFFTMLGFRLCLINRKKDGSKHIEDIAKLCCALESGDIEAVVVNSNN
jgi:glycine cleavage system protein P-like pyridoxal-binding family